MLTTTAIAVLERLAATNPARLRQVRRTLGLMETNLRHPSLSTHEFRSLRGPRGEKVFEAYVNADSDAFRVFFRYGARQDEITVVAITPHP